MAKCAAISPRRKPLNDDVVYELLLLDVYEKMGKAITSDALGDEWVRKLPYGVSAEGVALRNLNLGIYPPESGTFLNPYCDWIGAQMRTMVCGMLAPGDPMEAARLAYIDSSVSHARNGIYGGIYAAVITTLAFVMDDPRQIVVEGTRYIPARSEYAAKLSFILEVLRSTDDPSSAWPQFSISTSSATTGSMLIPTWQPTCWRCGTGQGISRSRWRCLAKAGYDVDCNGGLVGSVLGVIRDVPPAWADPIGDLLETYIKGKERLSIKALAERTADLAEKYC